METFLSEEDGDDVQSESGQHPRKLSRGWGGDVGLHGVHLESRSCLGQMDQTKMESMGSESFPLLSQRLGWVGQEPGTLERFEFNVR